MNRPDFSAITRHSVQRESRLKTGIPQSIPYGTRIFRCECCNDTGVVQAWKLNRWAVGPCEPQLDGNTSLPVFCQMLTSCGNTTMQVFAGNRDNDEAGERIAEVNLLKGNAAGESNLRGYIASGQLKCLSMEQSRYLHNKVLEYRELLACTAPGRQYVEDVKEACRQAAPSEEVIKTRLGNGRLMHVGEILRSVTLPTEPDWDAPTPVPVVVQISEPRDFTPAPAPATSFDF